MRLVQTENPGWKGRKHFFDVAAMAMRQLLCSQARKRNAQKRGGDRERVEFRIDTAGSTEEDVDVLSLSEALDKLEGLHPRQARMISLKYFAGLKEAEIAELLEVSDRTVRLDCQMARSWLRREMDRHDPQE